jgi:hypothetical protein
MKLNAEGFAEMKANGYITLADGRRLGPNGENYMDKPVQAPPAEVAMPATTENIPREENQGITNGSFDAANQYVMSHLAGLGQNVGTASLMLPRILKGTGKSVVGEFANPTEIDPEEELPLGPGKSYLAHLFKTHGLDKKIREQNSKVTQKTGNIFTDQAEAFKQAIQIVGCASDRNPGGLPIEIHEAKKFWFDGKEDVDEIDQAQFMSQAEGDNKIDPKRIRKFTNYDGSLTYEIINEDKSIMSRFTMGKFKGTTIFSQGGYKKFAELFKKARAKLGKDEGGEFDAIRASFRGE